MRPGKQALLAAAVVAGFTLAGALIEMHHRGTAVIHSAGGVQAAATVARATVVGPTEPSAPPQVLLADAQVQVVLQYPACGIRKVGSGPIPVGLIGQGRPAVAAALRPERITHFAPDLLVLDRRLPGCPADTVTLRVRDGVVVVLAGPPGDTGAVLQRTAIAGGALGAADARRLEAGLAVPAARAGEELHRLAREAGAVPS